MKKSKLILGALAVFLPFVAHANVPIDAWSLSDTVLTDDSLFIPDDIIYVDVNATGANDGTSWTDAFNSLTDAFTAYTATDNYVIIHVAGGVYLPPAGVGTPRQDTINIGFGSLINATDSVLIGIRGGFSGDSGSEFERWEEETVFSGEIGATTATDNIYHVVTFVDNDGGPYDASQDGRYGDDFVTAPFLEGVTIARGYANGSNATLNEDDDFGGGILFEARVTTESAMFPLIRKVVLFDNFALEGGGGVAILGEQLSMSPIISESWFLENEAENIGGGAVYSAENFGGLVCDYDPINDVFFIDNDGCETGARLVANVFQQNTTNQAGGAVYVKNTANMAIENSVFILNESDAQGGAVYTAVSANCVVVNCTIVRNRAQNDGGALFAVAGSDLEVANTVIYDNITANNDTTASLQVNAEADTVGNNNFISNYADDPDFVFVEDSQDELNAFTIADFSTLPSSRISFADFKADANELGVTDYEQQEYFDFIPPAGTDENDIDDASDSRVTSYVEFVTTVADTLGRYKTMMQQVLGGESGNEIWATFCQTISGEETISDLLSESGRDDGLYPWPLRRGTSNQFLVVSGGNDSLILNEGSAAFLPEDFANLDGNQFRGVRDPDFVICEQLPEHIVRLEQRVVGSAPDVGAYESQVVVVEIETPKVIYVDDNAPGDQNGVHDGNTWKSAYLFVADALKRAELDPEVDQIWVAEAENYDKSEAGSRRLYSISKDTWELDPGSWERPAYNPSRPSGLFVYAIDSDDDLYRPDTVLLDPKSDEGDGVLSTYPVPSYFSHDRYEEALEEAEVVAPNTYGFGGGDASPFLPLFGFDGADEAAGEDNALLDIGLGYYVRIDLQTVTTPTIYELIATGVAEGTQDFDTFGILFKGAPPDSLENDLLDTSMEPGNLFDPTLPEYNTPDVYVPISQYRSGPQPAGFYELLYPIEPAVDPDTGLDTPGPGTETFNYQELGYSMAFPDWSVYGAIYPADGIDWGDPDEDSTIPADSELVAGNVLDVTDLNVGYPEVGYDYGGKFGFYPGSQADIIDPENERYQVVAVQDSHFNKSWSFYIRPSYVDRRVQILGGFAGFRIAERSDIDGDGKVDANELPWGYQRFDSSAVDLGSEFDLSNDLANLAYEPLPRTSALGENYEPDSQGDEFDRRHRKPDLFPTILSGDLQVTRGIHGDYNDKDRYVYTVVTIPNDQVNRSLDPFLPATADPRPVGSLLEDYANMFNFGYLTGTDLDNHVSLDYDELLNADPSTDVISQLVDLYGENLDSLEEYYFDHIISDFIIERGHSVPGVVQSDYSTFGTAPAPGEVANTDFRGGGIDLFETRVVFSNVEIRENVAAMEGAGAFMIVSNPEFHQVCWDDNNSGGFGIAIEGSIDGGGGAAWIGQASDPVFLSNVFTANSAGVGGALYSADNSDPRVFNSFFMNNGASERGGALYLSNNPGAKNPLEVEFDMNFFVANQGGSAGGAVYGEFSSITFSNSVVSRNTAAFGPAMAFQGGNPEVWNTIFWGNTMDSDPFTNDVQIGLTASNPTVVYSVVQHGFLQGIAFMNTQFDPLLSDTLVFGAFDWPGSPTNYSAKEIAALAGPDRILGTLGADREDSFGLGFRLNPGSSAIDAGVFGDGTEGRDIGVYDSAANDGTGMGAMMNLALTIFGGDRSTIDDGWVYSMAYDLWYSDVAMPADGTAGWLWLNGAGWVYLYGPSAADIWFYIPNVGWVYTNETNWPYAWEYGSDTAVRFESLVVGP